MASGPPARIDRAALERILQRATELQAGEHDLGDDVSSDDVLALGRDVGIPARYLQQAILEEQSRVDTRSPSGILNWVAGPGSASAQRVVQGDVERVQLALMAYMEEQELLCVQRRQPGRVSWEPLGGFQATIRRSTAAFGSGKRPFMLDKARVVHATFTGLEAGYVHVSLIADLRQVRGAFVGGGAALGAVGVAGATILLALGAFPLIAIAPIALGTGLGYGAIRRYPSRVERVQLGLERALDHLEQGVPKARHELPPRSGKLGSLISDEIRKALKGLSVIALLASCSPATSRPPFEPLPEARTGVVQLDVAPATERLAEALNAEGIPAASVVARDGYVETPWFDASTGTRTSGRTLGENRVRVRGWVKPAGRYTSTITVEAVYRPFADPSAAERELEQSVAYSHPVRVKIRSAFATLRATSAEESDAVAFSARRSAREQVAAAAQPARKDPGPPAARPKLAADSARADTARAFTARADTARAAARADSLRPVAAADTTLRRSDTARLGIGRADSARREVSRSDTTARPAVARPPAALPAPVRPDTQQARRVPAAAPTTPAAGGYSVQVAATGDTTIANQAAIRLRDIGLTARIVREGGLLKVRTPLYPTETAARSMLGRVRSAFPDAFITPR